MKMLLKSKYFLITVLCMILTVAIFAGGSRYLATAGPDTDLAKLAGADIKTVVPLGAYQQIYILNGDKGLFIGQDKGSNGKWSLIDENGNATDIDYEGYFQKKNENCALLQGADQHLVIKYDKNSNDLLFCEYADIDKDGKYYLYLKDGKYFVEDINGNQIFEIPEEKTDGYDSLRFSGRDGYLVKVLDQKDYIINMATGEEEYHTNTKDAVYDYAAGRWIISLNEKEGSHSVEYLFLNNQYEEDFEGTTSDSEYYNDKYISGYGGIPYREFLASEDSVAFPGDGKGFYIRGAAEDSIIEGENHYNYLIVKDGRISTLLESDYMSYRDFEDGFAVATDDNNSDLYDDLYASSSSKSWGFIDENMKPVTKFKFNGASKTENGFAVVKVGRRTALIDLKGVK